jgi:kynurenine formamidase
LQPGDILALDTGWAERFGTEEYEYHPSLSPEAADWLVRQRVKLLAVDFATPDLPVRRRPAGFNWPVHHRLLGRVFSSASTSVATLHLLGAARILCSMP